MLVAETMAAYHGPYWEADLSARFGWLKTSAQWQRHLDSIINTEAMLRRGLVRAEGVLPPGLAARRDEIWPAFVRSLEVKVTVLHEGSVISEGSLDHVSADPRGIEVYLGR